MRHQMLYTRSSGCPTSDVMEKYYRRPTSVATGVGRLLTPREDFVFAGAFPHSFLLLFMLKLPYMSNRIWLIVFGDLMAFVVSFILLLLVRFGPEGFTAALNNHLLPFTILYLSWVIVFYIFGLYDLYSIKPTIPYLKRWILAILSSFGIGILLFYFEPHFIITPKINLIIQVIGFGIFSFSFRRINYILFSSTITRPAILVGNSAYLSELEKNISNNPQIGLKVINHFQNISDINLNLSDSKNLVIILDKNLETKDHSILNFYEQGAEIIDTAKAYEKYLLKIPVEYIDLSFIIEDVNIKKDILYTLATTILNTIFAITLLIITSPILLIVIIARLIEDGRPIFIKQKRVGLNGKVFDLYKLRSMIVLSPDGSAETKGAPVWATGSDDPRITPLGKIIRKLHIDEIPQMINILRGELTLVGPRPERPEFVALLSKDIPYYSFRHVIRPGFTGWAQIKYRYANSIEDSKEKFEYDLFYIKNRNIFIDSGIIAKTIQIIFTH